MAPTPQELAPEAKELPSALGPPELSGNRVVISGMSGIYPQMQHIKDLSEALYNKVNIFEEPNSRWVFDNPEVPPYVGVVPNLDRFDAQFFKVHYHLCCSMDTMARKVLEQSYQAIYDAGVNPEHLSGKKIGVFIGSCLSESEKASVYVTTHRNGFAIAGCNKSMFANRISYWLNAKGPSQAIDASCCSSTVALEQAYLAMSRGDCEAAIVGGANVCLHPQTSFHYGRTITLCKDGKTKSYDQCADGCVRSEAINVLFLQKASDAVRIYADLVHVKNSFVPIKTIETGQKYGFCREVGVMADFLREFYDEAKVSPSEVEYVEGFGSGDGDADKNELEAYDKFFCNDRSEPLPVGSVLSNVGYCEAASGITAVTKVLLGFHKGEVAANLHCDSPRSDVSGLREGRLQVVTENKPIQRSYIGVNGLSITGINSHILLHGHYKPKDLTKFECNIPRLVLLTARQDSAVENLISDLKSRPIDPEELALLQNIHSSKISGHLGRGYVLLDTNKENKTVSVREKADYFDSSDRPLWFVYSGMGSQWAGMGAQLMRIPIFAAAIERCRKVLETKGIDIVHIITSPDKTIYDNIIHSFVGIAAVQIGLTDILHALGLVPDKIIGHSLGELGCAYADGCLTAEEMILSAYSRGLVSIQTPFIRGSMAAIGIGFEKVSKLCPPEIEVACHNGPDSSTISGPADEMTEFVAQLTAKGIFAKEVPCSNIAYHSRYIADAGPGLLKYLTEVIATPKLRSEKWVSTSVPQEKWTEESAKYSSAEYHTNNLLSPVLFEETSRLVPANAVLVEVAPHGLLQAILKRSLPPSCAHVPLTRRGHADSARFLLEAIGNIYMEGYYPDIRPLYPKVEFPVSTGTPHLSHLVEWAHNETWLLPLYAGAKRKSTATCSFLISVHDPEHNYLLGNTIQGKVRYPFAGALVAAWDTLAMTLGAARRQLSVQFRDVQLFAQPALFDSRQLRLTVSLHRGNGLFEIYDDNSKVATGYINGEKINYHEDYFLQPNKEIEDIMLNTDDVYQILSDRGYAYGGQFRSIYDTNGSFTEGRLRWAGNWVALLDGALQLNALRQPHDGLSQPVYIRNMTIDVDVESKNMEEDGQQLMKIEICPSKDYIRCGGFVLENVRYRHIQSSDGEKIQLRALQFVPRFSDRPDSKLPDILQVFIQIIEENIGKNEINIVEVFDNQEVGSVFGNIQEIVHSVPGVSVHFNKICRNDILDSIVKQSDVVFIKDFSIDEKLSQCLYQLLKQNTYIISAEDLNEDLKRVRPKALYNIVSAHVADGRRFDLAQWRPQAAAPISAFSVRTDSDLALLQTARANLPSKHKILVLCSYPPVPGLKQLFKQWRRESERNQIHLLMFKNKKSEEIYIDQLPNLDLACNVVNHGELGGEYFLPVSGQPQANNALSLIVSHHGDLESMQWVESAKSLSSGVPVKVYFAGLNACDVMKANGEIAFDKGIDGNDDNYGMDFSGTIKSGQRVMGVVHGGALSDRVEARSELLWPVPEHWSLEDAATVPLPYAQAYYCLAVKYQLMPGMSILVSGGAGALGQAIISIALHLECSVFAVVSDVLKKRFLLKLFPQLKVDHVMTTRDRDFVDKVLTLTGGQGCNVVICGKGDNKNGYLACSSGHGVTIDYDQVKSNENFMFGMNYLSLARTYTRVDFSSLFRNNDIKVMKELKNCIAQGIISGAVRPLSRVSFAPDEAARAFRLLAASRHRGRVLLRLQPTLPPPAVPRIVCSPDHSQLLVCDDEGLTINLADRLVKRGAKKLHLHSTTFSSKFNLALESWRKKNVHVTTSAEDLNSSKTAINLVHVSLRMGQIEGVFIATHKNHAIIEHLDALTRTLCQTLKYFAVITKQSRTEEVICSSRAKDGFPSMLLYFPENNKVDGASNIVKPVKYREVINAVEGGLRSGQPVLYALESSAKETSLLQRVIATASVNITKDTPETTTLQDLGITQDSVHALSVLLKVEKDVVIDEEQIPLLTKQKIRELEESLKESDLSRKEGLNAIFSYVDPDELEATCEMVTLPTYNSSNKKRDDEFDSSQTFLCILPGLEGHHHRFRMMCERVKVSAFVMQPGLDYPNESIHEMTERFAKTYLKKIGDKSFYLIGYEMGVFTALKMAAILEDRGLNGTVFCLGGGPDEWLVELEAQLALAGGSDEQTLQDAVARHMCALMGGGGCAQLEAALRDAPGWRQKVQASVRALRGRVAHSAQYARALIEAAYVRVAQARRHAREQAQAAPRALRSRVVLLRCPGAPVAAPHPLQRYSRQPLAVHDLRAPPSRAPDDLRVAAIINQYLDQEILKEFENKNLCHTYLLNPLDFVGKAEKPTS